LVFAMAGEMRQRGVRRAKMDTARIIEMQVRLARVARLNAMGEIAATLAHELNQPLTAIAGYAGAAERLIERDDISPVRMTELLQKISLQATRARDIIGRIRGRVTQAEPSFAPHSLSEMVQESLPVAVAGTSVSFTTRRDFDPSADLVLADRIQVQQVIVNLIRNAVEAMAREPRRELRVGSRASEDGMIEAYVSDTGPGLAPELIDRLFEPFVTGKADGMGIGLSVSRSIVEAHGGTIRAASEPEGGATFRFTLPRAPAEVVQ
jgi:two-component system, LuxR family, sensor kinase FixL